MQTITLEETKMKLSHLLQELRVIPLLLVTGSLYACGGQSAPISSSGQSTSEFQAISSARGVENKAQRDATDNTPSNSKKNGKGDPTVVLAPSGPDVSFINI